MNDATLEEGVARFLAALNRAAESVPRSMNGAPGPAWVNRQISATRRRTRTASAK